MTGQEIITMFGELTGESLDDDAGLRLMSMAKDKVEAERPWEMLKVLDNSNTSVVGRTYSTGYDLPIDFAYDRKIVINGLELTPVPSDEQIAYKDSEGYYFIDIANDTFHLCGIVKTAHTIYLFYIKFTPAITLTTSPVWPTRFHPYLAFKMAEIYQAGQDADDISYRMSATQRKEADELHEAMIDWDDQLKIKAMDHSSKGAGRGYKNVSGTININE
jgi:hypothetical protein